MQPALSVRAGFALFAEHRGEVVQRRRGPGRSAFVEIAACLGDRNTALGQTVHLCSSAVVGERRRRAARPSSCNAEAASSSSCRTGSTSSSARVWVAETLATKSRLLMVLPLLGRRALHRVLLLVWRAVRTPRTVHNPAPPWRCRLRGCALSGNVTFESELGDSARRRFLPGCASGGGGQRLAASSSRSGPSAPEYRLHPDKLRDQQRRRPRLDLPAAPSATASVEPCDRAEKARLDGNLADHCLDETSCPRDEENRLSPRPRICL